MNSANQPKLINQNNQNTANNQMNPNNQKEIEPVHYFLQPVELPSESIKPIASAEKVVCMYDSSSEYSSYSEWSDSTEDLIDMLDEQPDHLWDLSSDSDY